MATTEHASSGIPGQFAPTAESAARTSNLRILLVDDNALNLSAGQAMISRFGHQIDTAANGGDAIKAVLCGNYDLVLLDVRMPDMDGPETARRIRRLDLRQPRIIALTASASSRDRLACRNAGMDGYLLKPLRRPALVQLLDAEQDIADKPGPASTERRPRIFAHGHTG